MWGSWGSDRRRGASILKWPEFWLLAFHFLHFIAILMSIFTIFVALHVRFHFIHFTLHLSILCEFTIFIHRNYLIIYFCAVSPLLTYQAGWRVNWLPLSCSTAGWRWQMLDGEIMWNPAFSCNKKWSLLGFPHKKPGVPIQNKVIRRVSIPEGRGESKTGPF